MIPIYEATIRPLKRALKNLSAILKKGEAYADANQIEHSVLLNARLFPECIRSLDRYKSQLI
jgi:uncharacterized protein